MRSNLFYFSLLPVPHIILGPSQEPRTELRDALSIRGMHFPVAREAVGDLDFRTASEIAAEPLVEEFGLALAAGGATPPKKRKDNDDHMQLLLKSAKDLDVLPTR